MCTMFFFSMCSLSVNHTMLVHLLTPELHLLKNLCAFFFLFSVLFHFFKLVFACVQRDSVGMQQDLSILL